jgi:hypothetical protein
VSGIYQLSAGMAKPDLGKAVNESITPALFIKRLNEVSGMLATLATSFKPTCLL